jgi:hypothetical protein
MDLSVIIVSWNVHDLLKKCLKTLFQFNTGNNYEVFVVDNASKDQSAEMVAKEFPRVHLIKSLQNLGFAKGNNVAIKKAQGKYILLLNPDTEFIEPVFDKILDFFKGHADADIVGCKLLNPDKSLQQSVRSFPTLYSSLVQISKLHHLFPPEKILKKYLCSNLDYSKTQKVDQVMGAFLMYKKELGLMDENYFLWLEEVDLCKRAKNVYYTPEARIIHYGGSSFKQVATMAKQKIFYKSLWYYFRKFGL